MTMVGLPTNPVKIYYPEKSDKNSMTSIPQDIQLHKKSATLELCYADGIRFQLTAEFLRVHSPSAEVRGHGKDQEVLQTGKRDVKILDVEIVGNYAIKLVFDDRHDSGIYSWDYLKNLCVNNNKLWKQYLQKLKIAHASRIDLPPDTQVIKMYPLDPDK